ncbi:MAG: hypothetical protein Q7T21_09250 [Gallionella sp.]|nr:hypothetical protein [Gallionella sp.]
MRNSNSNNLTEHAQRRKQQRGITDMQIDLIRYFGSDHYQKGGCSLSYIDEKTIKQLRCAIDKLANTAIVKTPREHVATVMHMDRRIHTTKYVA